MLQWHSYIVLLSVNKLPKIKFNFIGSLLYYVFSSVTVGQKAFTYVA